MDEGDPAESCAVLWGVVGVPGGFALMSVAVGVWECWASRNEPTAQLCDLWRRITLFGRPSDLLVSRVDAIQVFVVTSRSAAVPADLVKLLWCGCKSAVMVPAGHTFSNKDTHSKQQRLYQNSCRKPINTSILWTLTFMIITKKSLTSSACRGVPRPPTCEDSCRRMRRKRAACTPSTRLVVTPAAGHSVGA